MTAVATASTAARDAAAGEDLARQLKQGLNGAVPDAVIVFISATE